VIDIYDQYHDGIQAPVAIQRFLQHHYQLTSSPKLQYVLLVGDANWAGTQTVDLNHSESELSSAFYIPSWQYFSNEGPAVSDYPYSELDSKQNGPEIALGRLPVRSVADLEGIITKIIHYQSQQSLGPWRNRLLMVNDDTRRFQKRNQQLAHGFNQSSWQTEPFSSTAFPDDQDIGANLAQTMSNGNLITHFYGHGGRFMWQLKSSGSSRFFEIDDLDNLLPHNKLPMVLSMTCSSGPFDHPNADSLAEKLLRLPDRGAIAVLAAGARNHPTRRFTEHLMQSILDTDTIGKAIQQTKQHIGNERSAAMYNLLGDPAVSLAKPQHSMKIDIDADSSNLLIELNNTAFSGQIQWDWIAENGSLLKTDQRSVNTSTIAIPIMAEAYAAKFYAWSNAQEFDAAGWIELPKN